MGKYKTYEKYKPSGVEWLGEVPEHWEVIKLKYIANVNPSNIDKKSNENEKQVLLCNYVDVYKNEFISSELDFMSATATDEQIRKFTLRQDDVIVTKDSETADDIANPALVIENLDDVVCGYHLTHIKPIKVDGNFLFRYFQSKHLKAYFEVSANGVTRFGLGVDKFNSALILIPPIAEQKQIARFLDRETTRIDTLITKKRQLIDLLHKKRDALVDSFVIKVSDPHEAIKKADMSWLNDLPDDWGNVRLKFLSSFITSGSRGWAEYYSDEGSVFLRIGNLSTESIDLDLTDLQFVQPPKGAEGERTRVYPNDLLISITALIGAVGVVPSNINQAYVNQHTALVRLLNQHIHSRWAAYCVFSSLGQKQLGEFTSGGTKDGLTLSDVGNLLVLIPPDKDQELYVKEIDRKINSIQSTILKTKESIRVLEKYRTALITAAVTGKIDVREEVN